MRASCTIMVATIMLLTIMALCLTPASVHAQAASDKAVQVWVNSTNEIGDGRANVTLIWKDRTGLTSYTVSSWLVGTVTKSWTPLAVGFPAGTANIMRNFTFTIPVGVEYEIQIQGYGAVSTFGYVSVAVKLPVIDNRGSLLLLVDGRLNVTLAGEISRLIQELSMDGWVVVRHDIATTTLPSSVRTMIMALYSTQTPTLTSIYIFGHVPVPYSGELCPDAHTDHQGALPSDLIYGSIGTGWTDISVNTSTNDAANAIRATSKNVPGDGRWDQSTWDYYTAVSPTAMRPLMSVGRVDLSSMTSFAKNETSLMRQYLKRATNWKNGATIVPNNAVIRDGFGYMGGEAFSSSGWRSYSSLIKANVTILGGTSFWPHIGNNTYLFAHGCGGGSFGSASQVGSTTDFAKNPTMVVFMMLFGSYFGDWDNANNFLRAPLASDGLALTNSWGGRPHHFYHHMGVGHDAGYSLLKSARNEYDSSPNYAPQNYGGGWVGQALMGDPTVRVNPFAPASGVSIDHGTVNDVITWQASSATGDISYVVYVSEVTSAGVPFGGYSRAVGISSSPTTYTSDIKSYRYYIYIVKAVRLEVTGSGSYYNSALGVATPLINNTATATSSSSTGTVVASSSTGNSNSTSTSSSSRTSVSLGASGAIMMVMCQALLALIFGRTA